MSTRLWSAVSVAAVLAATLVVYGDVLGCFFWADDIAFLYDARNGSPLEFVLTPYGGHLSWVRNLVFLGLERVFGPRPEPFFALVLVTHLANVALCWLVVHAFTGSRLLAAVWATWWGTSPRNAITLGWFAGHAQMIVGTVMLVLLWRAAVLTRRGAEPTARDVWLAVVLTIFAAGSFGIGLGVGLVVPLAALLLFPRASWRRQRVLLALVGILPFLYVVGQLLPALFPSRGWPMVGASSMVGALPVALDLTVLLVGTGLAGLLTGFTMTRPVSVAEAYTAAVGLMAVFVVAVVMADGPGRRRLLAVALMPLAIYGITAVGRAPTLAFSGGPARLAGTPRYHYTGPLALAVLGALLCAEIQRRMRVPAAVGSTLAAVALTADAVAWDRSAWRFQTHDWVRQQAEAALAEVDAVAASVPPGLPVVVPNRPFAGVGPIFIKTPELFPRLAGLFIAFRSEDTVAGHPVRFAETEPHVYAHLVADPNDRIARLLVPAGFEP